jgi:hypothetical protein
MESALQLVLGRLSSPEAVFSYDEVCEWSADEYAALNTAGLIVETGGLAKQVLCDACPDAHWEPVRGGENGNPAFIVCSVAGVLDVSSERRRCWRVSFTKFAAHLFQGLGLSGQVEWLPEGRIWRLGYLILPSSRHWILFAAIEREELGVTIKAIQANYGRGNGALLVPFCPPDRDEKDHLQIVSLSNVIRLENKQITVERLYVEEQFGETHGVKAKKPSRALMAHRRAILQAYAKSKEIDDMITLGTHLRMGCSVLYGMVRGDTRKYGETRLKAMLLDIGCSRAKWDRVPKPSHA